VSLALLVACGGGGDGGGKTATSTRPATKAETPRVTRETAALTGTPTTDTATPGGQLPATPGATQPGGQPSAAPVPTQPPAPQPSNTPPPSGQTIDVSLREFSLALSEGTAPAGAVTFNVSNDGTVSHDFAVIKTDLSPDALPVDPATFQVRLSELNLITFQPPFGSGTSVQVAVDLSAGGYVLICNIASHYQAGMRVAFAVQ